ncbi:hypothetical protein [Tropicibacter sp. Alg240-R139]|uniref:hypothetical protein n=1 Tax=Tropicibacter sp. Alg240-R139 TaxID=2305991 RepID=UPI0013DEA542|nr:hypothetical protein [Tropicibacter sp. Alg240-R139]
MARSLAGEHEMDITRSPTDTRRTTQIGQIVTELNGPCVGCSECRGICLALIDAVTLPEILLRRTESR